MREKISWLGQFLANPRQTAALTPASPDLSYKMARATVETLPEGGRVIEIGCGFGTITRHLIEQGLPREHLVGIDLSQKAVEKTSQLGVRAIRMDARQLDRLLGEMGWENCQAVVSSLGLLNMPSSVRDRILICVDEVLDQGGFFIQYTYGRGDPTKGMAQHLGWQVDHNEFTWRNVPPAYVWRWKKPN